MSWIDRYRTRIAFFLAASIVVAVVIWIVRQPRAADVEILLPDPTPSPPAVIHLPTIRVYVCGAVAQPDVYELPPDSIVKDALLAAGGATRDADLIRINLAQALQDQMQVYVPHQGESQAMSPSRSLMEPSGLSLPSSGSAVNLNTATLEELESLPGIGPALAQRIVDYRPYRTTEEITNVPGIGEKTYEKLKGLITVE